MRRIAAVTLCLALMLPLLALSTGADAQTPSRKIYWGAMIKGNTYGFEDPPWDLRTLDTFERNAGKKLSILHWGQAWWYCGASCGYQAFHEQRGQYEAMRQRGIIPLVDWSPWDPYRNPQYDNPQFSLHTIIDGTHDAYIRQWASEAKDWGHPFFVRMAHEMNGDWYPWSERRNGNSSGQFVQAWRHVHDIFTQVGATNVSWVWCPNIDDDANKIPLGDVYPGDAYVDWTCMDGYNWGTNPSRPDRWKSFYEVFRPTYEKLLALTPAKPIMIGETGSTEHGGSKAEWIADALGTQLPNNFPQIGAVLWFNWNTDGMDWTIETSPAAQQAFAAAIASPYYAESEFASLSTSPIPPYSQPQRPRLPQQPENRVYLPAVNNRQEASAYPAP